MTENGGFLMAENVSVRSIVECCCLPNLQGKVYNTARQTQQQLIRSPIRLLRVYSELRAVETDD